MQIQMCPFMLQMPSTRTSGHQRPMRRPFIAPQYSCDEPGCGWWFQNLSGLTQNKRRSNSFFNRLHQSFPNHAGSSGSLGQEQHDADGPAGPLGQEQHNAERMSLVPEYSFDGHQGEGPTLDGHQGNNPLNREHEAIMTEFVGPGSRVYHNYHAGLNGKPADP